MPTRVLPSEQTASRPLPAMCAEGYAPPIPARPNKAAAELPGPAVRATVAALIAHKPQAAPRLSIQVDAGPGPTPTLSPQLAVESVGPHCPAKPRQYGKPQQMTQSLRAPTNGTCHKVSG